jgi:predicted transcriptional regulator of viral defense system
MQIRGVARKRRAQLYHLAFAQGGLFTAAQAREIGYAYQVQAHHLKKRNWKKVDRGIYRLPEIPASRFDDLHRWLLWTRGRGVISHQTAAAAYELGELMPARIHLTVPKTFRSTRRPAEHVVLRKENLPEADVWVWEGLRMTKPLRTIMDLVPVMEGARLASIVREALDRGLVRERSLRTALDALEVHDRRRLAAALDRSSP